jgi:hypothetical protein
MYILNGTLKQPFAEAVVEVLKAAQFGVVADATYRVFSRTGRR